MVNGEARRYHSRAMKYAALLLLSACFALAAPVTALADQDATFKGPTSSSENAFVKAIQADLMQRYPTAADAEKAGYVRYTSEDHTGAISYANMQWASQDIKHPSQLWYDKNGNLLGADYSVLYAKGMARPVLWGVNPGRWVEFDAHMHYVTKDASTGKMTYDGWTWDKDFVAAGGSIAQPNAATLVAMKKVTDAGTVVTLFHFPAVWDLIVWVKPNSNGAFADKNPAVTP